MTPPTLADILAAGGDRAPGHPWGRTAFTAPWQAQVFAMTVALHESGLFTWPEWAEALGRRISAGSPSTDEPGAEYYRQWAAALIDLLETKGVADEEAVAELEAAWHAAAARTPHGQPIVLP